MSNLSILSKAEQEIFESEPTFTLKEKQYFFKIEELLTALFNLAYFQ